MKSASKRFLLFLILSMLILTSFNINAVSYENIIPTDIENLSSKQELTIPIDTNLEEAKFRPIDVRVDFDSPCWAKNETVHSVRVAYGDGSDLTEIDSQIYDLESSDGSSNIKACSLVFLIPKEATGEETYYVLYSDSETSPPDYEDHLSVKDTHYFYEPISGQIIDFDYYQIIEGEYIIYGICQQGELLGNGMSNAVIKLKPGSTEFETVHAEQIAAFSMSYSIEPSGENTGTQWATDVSKQIIVDGNLMIRLRIEGSATEGEIKTDDIYTYYYSPTSTKSLNVNINHEVLKTRDIKGDQEREGTYTSLSTIKARSATIEKMNIGEILPNIHFHAEDESIREYSMPTNPDADPAEWILSATDDDDLGSKAWLCMDDPSTGHAHGLIFGSSTGFLEGAEDGIQVKSSVHQHVNLPGLEADSGDLFAIRNAYEGGKHNTVLPEGMNVNFNIEFITFQKGGYEAVDAESEIYQELVGDRPIYRGNVSDEPEEEKERYALTAYLHRARSFPMGSLLSAGLGRNISYISAELYKDDSLASSGSAGRISMGDLNLDFDNTTLVQKIKLALGLFDWKNFSFFKKIRFPDLEAGRYLVKVYRENPAFGKERQYIGFTIVDLNGETSVDIYCKSEGTAELSIADQDENGIENVKFLLLSDETIVSSEVSGKNGSVVLKAPCYRKSPYKLQVIYLGFLVEEKEISFGLKTSLISYKDTFSTSLSQLKLKVKDTLGLVPAVDVGPMLTSSQMVDQITISAENQGNGEYLFTDLYSGDYVLKMSYKSFILEEKVKISNDKTIDLEFPAEFTVDLNCMNSYGALIGEGEISLDREGRGPSARIKTSGVACVSVPPGIYEMKITADNEEIARQDIEIKGNKVIDIVTSQGSFLHTVVMYLGALLAVFSIALIVWKRNTFVGMKLLAIALIVIALVLPWWILTGNDNTTSTVTSTLLVPSEIITLTSSHSVFGGEISSVPPEFTMVLELLVMLLVVDCLFVLVGISIGIFMKDKFRKISTILSIVGIVLLLVSILLFYVAMSEVTNVGVGSFSGGSTLAVSVPGLQENSDIDCTWGPGSGLYLSMLALVSMAALSLLKIVRKVIEKIRKRL
ncbi:MAG: hypothetical protein U9R21_09635 [Candidatus Thermoplasmatota archaeon]|nr:hypothetical protein [Candidatus Thermoplasmatota archaeon]